jgi:Tfp pilus assembly protein PilN
MIFNLLPWRENLQRKKLRILLMQFFMILLLTLLLSAFFQAKNQLIIQRQKELISRLCAQKPKNNEAKEIEKNIFDEIATQIQFVKFLSTINNLLPNTIYLTKLEKIDRSLQLWGNAPSNVEILTLLEQFNKKFPNEKLLLSETNHNNKNNDEIDFSLIYRIK